MKQFTVLVGALLCAAVSHAQVTITGANNYQVGDVITSESCDPTGITAGASGANVTWDFSGLTSAGSTSSQLLAPGSLTYASAFGSSINAGTSTASGEGYFYIDNNEYTIVGASLSNNDIVDNYTSDPREVVTFPISYGDVVNETFSGTQVNSLASVTWNRGGTITIEADGYGTLILPTGTFNDVLRIKVTTIYSDTHPTFPSIDYDDVVYLWYHVGSRGYLLSYGEFIVSNFGIPVPPVITVNYYGTIPVSTADLDGQSLQLNAFPNPMQNEAQVQLSGMGGEAFQLEVTDLNGRLVESRQVNAAEQHIATLGQDYPSGIYLVRAYSATQSRVVRLVKQ